MEKMKQRLSSCLRSVANQWSLLLKRGTGGRKGGSKAISTTVEGTSLRLLRIDVSISINCCLKKSFVTFHCSVVVSTAAY